MKISRIFAHLTLRWQIMGGGGGRPKKSFKNFIINFAEKYLDFSNRFSKIKLSHYGVQLHCGAEKTHLSVTGVRILIQNCEFTLHYMYTLFDTVNLLQ
jgi:hypothetical protein